MATSEGIPSSIDIEFLELNDNPYIILVKQPCWVVNLEPQADIACMDSPEWQGWPLVAKILNMLHYQSAKNHASGLLSAS